MLELMQSSGCHASHCRGLRGSMEKKERGGEWCRVMNRRRCKTALLG